MAARGLLRCPEEHIYLLQLIAQHGVDIELVKELLYSKIEEYLSLKEFDKVSELRKELVKTIFPDHKTNDEKLIESARQQISSTGEKMRIHVDTKSAIKSENPLQGFK